MSAWFRSTPQSEALLAEERLILAATELVHEAMENCAVNKKELAERLGVQPSEVSQRLKGKRNLTLRSFAAMLHQLDSSVELRLSKRNASHVQPDPPDLRQSSKFSGAAENTYVRRPPLRVINGTAA